MADLGVIVAVVVVGVGVVLVSVRQRKRVHPDPLPFVDMLRETLRDNDEHGHFDC